MQIVAMLGCGPCTFQVAEKAYGAYEVWNIGESIAGYIPFCLMAQRQPFKGARNIDVNRLLAVKCDATAAAIIMKAAGHGFTSPNRVRAYIKRHDKPNISRQIKRDLELAKSVLPLLEELF